MDTKLSRPQLQADQSPKSDPQEKKPLINSWVKRDEVDATIDWAKNGTNREDTKNKKPDIKELKKGQVQLVFN